MRLMVSVHELVNSIIGGMLIINIDLQLLLLFQGIIYFTFLIMG